MKTCDSNAEACSRAENELLVDTQMVKYLSADESSEEEDYGDEEMSCVANEEDESGPKRKINSCTVEDLEESI